MATSTDEATNRKIHTGVVSQQFKISKWAPFSKKARLIILLIVLIGAALTGGFIAIHNYQVKRAKIDRPKLLSLIKKNDCSSSAMKSVSAERPNNNDVQGSIVLLSYRETCQTFAGDYKAANGSLEQLKTYYQLQDNNTAVAAIDQQIAANKYTLANPLTHNIKIAPELSPEASRKVNEVFGNSE